MRKIIYALLVLLPLCGMASFAQAETDPTIANIIVSSVATNSKIGNYNFGTVRKASVTKNFTITNRGPAELLITAINLKENNKGFEIIKNACVNTPMKKLSRCQITVKYTPQIETYNQTKTDFLVIEGNLPNGVKEIKLQAKDSLRPVLGFSLNKFVNSSASRNNIFTFNFNKINKAVNRTLYVRNTGNTPLIVSSIKLTDTGEQWQVNTTNCEKTIAAGKYCALTLKFTPNAEHYKVATESLLIATTNDPLRGETVAKIKISNNFKPVVKKNIVVDDDTAPAEPVTPTQPPQAQNNCPGNCVASSLDCMGEGKTADWTDAHSCHNTNNPVCCIINQNSVVPTTPIPTPTPTQAAACAETDGYLGVDTATDFNHRGTVSGYNHDGTAFNYTDFCTDNSLTEYFCYNPIINGLPVWHSLNANCSADANDECRNGACACKPELDADGDGICNDDDHCPGTPAGKWVDYLGC